MSEPSPAETTPVTVRHLRRMKAEGRRIVALTAYDASFAAVLDEGGVDVVLVGDSLGMVVQGHDSTVPVTLDDMVYHARAVARGCRRALRVVDMPFGTYGSPAAAYAAAVRLMQEGGAQVVKLEGGAVQREVVRHLSERGVPVCAHLGLTPQWVHKLGGYRLQGREREAAERMAAEAKLLEAAGAELLVLECVPAALAARIRRELAIPVIGIGAGPDCDGQVLVLYDLLGLTRAPRFARDFLAGRGSVREAVTAYCQAVRDGRFPGPEETLA